MPNHYVFMPQLWPSHLQVCLFVFVLLLSELCNMWYGDELWIPQLCWHVIMSSIGCLGFSWPCVVEDTNLMTCLTE